MVFCHATEPGLSRAKLLLDDTKWVLNFGPYVGLSGFHQILQPSSWVLGSARRFLGLMATRKVILLSEISGRFSIP
jgi:hypothetical protein